MDGKEESKAEATWSRGTEKASIVAFSSLACCRFAHTLQRKCVIWSEARCQHTRAAQLENEDIDIKTEIGASR